jgi:hypothetical protein
MLFSSLVALAYDPDEDSSYVVSSLSCFLSFSYDKLASVSSSCFGSTPTSSSFSLGW